MKKKLLFLPLAFIIILGSYFLFFSKKDNYLEKKPFSYDNLNLYFVMTDRFYDGNKKNNTSYGRPNVDSKGTNIGTFHGGDIKGLTKKLEEGYFTDLGINAIWITSPIEQIHGFISGDNQGGFAHYGYHGYYALDFTSMDKNMGTVEEMREFVDTAHSMGIRILLDVVINHVGYSNLQDMYDYEFYPVKNGVDIESLNNWEPKENETFKSYNDTLIDYNSKEKEWAKWWGPNWIRASLPGYTPGGNTDISMNLSGLPDIKTETTEAVNLPPILTRKWEKDEEENNSNWIIPASIKYRKDLNLSPSDYIVTWLSSWVEEFGIDGFRADTAKHIEPEIFLKLKEKSNEALKTWRLNNPDSPGSSWNEDFFMVAEVFNQGLDNNYYYDNGFYSVINFKFPKNPSLDSLEKIYSNYSNQINTTEDFNVLSYISSHDTGLSRGNLINLGTKLLLSPGGIQIYYGDETNRLSYTSISTTAVDQGSRSNMNWDSIDKEVLSHFQKLGQFRSNHLSVGGGIHEMIDSTDYAFKRTYEKDGISDKVVIGLAEDGEITIDVSTVFEEGSEILDFYSNKTSKVIDGKVTFKVSENLIVLLEENK